VAAYYGYLLRQLHNCLDQTITGAMASMDLTAAQGRIIGFVIHSPRPPCPRDLEEHFGLSHPTVLGLLSRLEKKGFLAFYPDPQDRRVKRIHLLDRGTDCSEHIRCSIEQCEGIMAQGFTAQELELFRGYLSRAISNLEHSVRENTATERSKQ
jgi:DNA-binding MarR family transcriptional regulator